MRRNSIAIAALKRLDSVRRLSAAALLGAFAVFAAGSARAEDPTPVTADADVQQADRDRALLAEIGLDLARIEQTGDVALLWRAVRELVLPGRVSQATRERILRRVWLADPATRDASRVDSAVN